MERDAHPMADRTSQNEEMPNEMHIGDFVHDKKDNAHCVGDAFSQ